MSLRRRVIFSRVPRFGETEAAAAGAVGTAGAGAGGTRNIAGPDVWPLAELGRITLRAKGDKRKAVRDDQAGMFAAVRQDAIIAGDDAHIAPTHYQDWLKA